ncbi:MAG: class I SAM-dependent rRNA methyltransferase [Oscillospiraceae bacterium]|nr:class I SAM-dependent rRNA methyltransferase [Oscillospiraceae bacterium]
MKAQRKFPAAQITPKGEAALRAGHPWVYDQEIEFLDSPPENGGLADVFSKKGAYLGTGFYSEKSKIRLRILSSNANETFGEAFFQRRARYALEYRRRVMGADFSCCRLIFGEADGLPGLTVDRYGDLLVTEVLSVGTEGVKEAVYGEICRFLAAEGTPVRGIYERNEAAIRDLEGLPRQKGWYRADFLPAPPESPLTEIVENGVRYAVDVENGQKTGFFLDQKYNRLAVSRLAKGMRVLDCFTHTGSFALNAAYGGAEHVTAVDVSQAAVDMARENARRNGLEDKMDFLCADVFDLLPELLKQGGSPYDLIILDPPAFTKSRKTVSAAARGYKEINYRAMRLLPRGGYLVTCSCSHFMEPELFRKTITAAARDAGVGLRLIEERRAAPDHPMLMTVPETDYLKFMMLQIV